MGESSSDRGRLVLIDGGFRPEDVTYANTALAPMSLVKHTANELKQLTVTILHSEVTMREHAETFPYGVHEDPVNSLPWKQGFSMGWSLGNADGLATAAKWNKELERWLRAEIKHIRLTSPALKSVDEHDTRKEPLSITRRLWLSIRRFLFRRSA